MNRNTLLLGSLFVVLVIVAFFLMQRPGEQSANPSDGELILGCDSAAVDRIEVIASSSTVKLSKRGADWFIDEPISYRADQAAVGRLLGKCSDARAGAVVSDKPGKHSMFQVDSTGTLVRLFENGTEKALIIGKAGPSYSGVYVRRKNSDEVLLTDASLSSSAVRSLKDWRDRTITKVPVETINDVRFQYGDTTFSVVLQDSVWRIDNEIANDAAIVGFLGSLASIQADDFVDTLPSRMNHVASVVFAGIQLRFSQTNGSDTFIVQSSSTPQAFELQGWHANQILKRKKDFLKVGS